MTNYRFFLIYNGVQHLIQEPVGFDDFTPRLVRDPDTHGLQMEAADWELKFDKAAGYKILKEAYETDVNSSVVFLCEFQCGANKPWREYYRGMVDFMSYEERFEKYCFINARVQKSDDQRTVKNRKTTFVDLDLPVSFEGGALVPYENLGKPLDMPSKTIRMRSELRNDEDGITNFLVGWNQTGYSTVPFADNPFSELEHIFGGFHNGFVLDELQNTFYTDNERDVKIEYDIRAIIFAQNAEALFPVTVQVKLSLNYGNEELESCEQRMEPPIEVFECSSSITKTMSANTYLKLFFTFTNPDLQGWVPNANITIKLIEGSFFRVTSNTKASVTTSKVYMLHEALNRTIESYTDGRLTVKSDFYGRTDSEVNPTTVDGCGSLRAINNGLLLRQAVLTDGDVKMLVQWKKLFESLKAIDNVGYGFEGNYLRLEPAEWFYKDDIIFECDDFRAYKKAIAQDFCYQNLNIGYNKWLADTYNSIDSFHGKRQYRTDMRVHNQVAEHYSDLIADGYAIEATRRRQFSEPSKNWQYDNDLFIYDLKRKQDSLEVEINLGTEDAGGVSCPTLIDPDTIYNARLSPARMAMRWLSEIRRTPNTDKLTYTGGEGYVNAHMKTSGNCVIESEAILESQDITESNFSGTVFKGLSAETFTFEFPLRPSEFIKIRENPYGLVRAGKYIGWIKDLAWETATGLGEFTLLLKK